MYPVMDKLLEFENTLKPLMAQGYSRDDAITVALHQIQ